MTGAVYADVSASRDGSWEVPALPLPAGETTLVAVGEQRSEPWTVRLESPVPLAAPWSARPVTLVVLAGTGLVEVLVDGAVVQRTTSVAPGFALPLDLASGEHAIAVRYASEDGRRGADAVTRVVVR